MRLRRRAGYEKSRNGCSTCKIRRVKCDEATPSCRRCTETGRKCEGPVVGQILFIHDRQTRKAPSTAPASLKPELSLFAPLHSNEARRAFHYFRHHAIHLVAVPFDASFWKDLVLQLAHTHTFVWNSIVGISLINEHVPYTSLETLWDSPTAQLRVVNQYHSQALKFYNTAIANVRHLAELGQVDESFVVLSYILFAAFEFGQRNVKTATDLMRKSCKILTANLTTPLRTKQNLSATAQAVHQIVTPFVLGKVVLTATLGKGPSPSDWVVRNRASSEVIEVVLSRSPWLEEARDQLHGLIFDSYEVIRVAEFILDAVWENNEWKDMFSSIRQSVLVKLMQWKVSFTAAAKHSTQTPDAGVDWLIAYMSMYWEVCYTSLGASASHLETTFDNYTDHFVEIVKHASVCVKHIDACSSTEVEQLMSSFDPGIVPPLYFCATKCRVPLLRRKALHLMRRALAREKNLWAFVEPHRVVTTLISAEEAGGNYLVLTSPSETSDCPDSQWVNPTSRLPPEERRFTRVSVVGRPTPGGRQRLALELSRFASAKDGSRKLIHEYTWLEDEDEEVWLSPSS